MSIPTHMGLILDGSRRYARSKSLPTIKGHEAGAQVLEKILQHLENTSINQVTLYTFSTENFNRAKEEVEGLMSLFKQCAEQLFSSKKASKSDTKIVFLGNKSLFDSDIQQKMEKIETETAQNKTRKINVAFGYGGRDEIVRAVQKIVNSGEQTITEELITQSLDLTDEPDIIVRTGGVHRTSNFLPWQSVYSEWFFLEKMWPEVTSIDIDSILEEFTSRKRRFGK